jgi:Domain of unknown function (DUF6983)
MAISAYEIPLTPQAQTFSISLNGTTYNLTLMWRSVDSLGGWVLDVADASNNPIVQGIPLVTGCDLLRQYRYLGFGGGLWVLTDGDATAIPTYTNLGQTSHLYFVVTS